MDVSLLNIGLQAGVILTLCVIAGVKFIDELSNKKYWDAAKIIVAALVGGAASIGLDGVTILAGVAYGLAASGLITTVGFGKKSTPIAEPELG